MEKLKSSVHGTLRLFQRMVSSYYSLTLSHTRTKSTSLLKNIVVYKTPFSLNKKSTLTSSLYFSLAVIFPLDLPFARCAAAGYPLLFVIPSESTEREHV